MGYYEWPYQPAALDHWERINASRHCYCAIVLWSYYCASHCSINRRERMNASQCCYCVSNSVMNLLLCLPLLYYLGIMSVYVSQQLQTTQGGWVQDGTVIVSQTLLWCYYCASHGCIKWVLWTFLSASSSRPQRVDESKSTLLLCP
jgi:hypothetical protein